MLCTIINTLVLTVVPIVGRGFNLNIKRGQRLAGLAEGTQERFTPLLEK